MSTSVVGSVITGLLVYFLSSSKDGRSLGNVSRKGCYIEWRALRLCHMSRPPVIVSKTQPLLPIAWLRPMSGISASDSDSDVNPMPRLHQSQASSEEIESPDGSSESETLILGQVRRR